MVHYRKAKLPNPIYAMIIQLYEDQQDLVRHPQDLSTPFSISNYVKQGSIIASMLFSTFQ